MKLTLGTTSATLESLIGATDMVKLRQLFKANKSITLYNNTSGQTAYIETSGDDATSAAGYPLAYQVPLTFHNIERNKVKLIGSAAAMDIRLFVSNGFTNN